LRAQGLSIDLEVGAIRDLPRRATAARRRALALGAATATRARRARRFP